MATTESTEGIIYEGRRFLSAQNVEVLDLISEGEIEGLASGNYIVNGVSGEFGWRGASFSGFQSLVPGQQFLRSVYWNETSVIDDNGRYNFQRVSLDFGNGSADGNPDLRLGEREIVNENFNPITTIGSRKDFQKNNNELNAALLAFGQIFPFGELGGEILNKMFNINNPVYGPAFASVFNSNFNTSSKINPNSGIYRFLSSGVKFLAGKRYQFVIQLGIPLGATVLIATHYKSGDKTEPSSYQVLRSTANPQTFTLNLTPSQDSHELGIHIQGPCRSIIDEQASQKWGPVYKTICDTGTPTLFIADMMQVRSISGGSIPSTINVEKEAGENFVVKASASTSYNPNLYTFLFQNDAQSWGAYGGATMTHSTSDQGYILISPATALHTDNTYGGASYNTGRTWDFEQEGCIAISAKTTNSASAKVRFSVRTDVSSNIEILGFDLTITNNLSIYEFLSIANKSTTSYVIFISCLESGKNILIDFLQLNRAMMRVELDLPKRLELFKEYNFSMDAYGKYVGYDSISAIPLVAAISNRQNGVELMSNQVNTSAIQM